MAGISLEEFADRIEEVMPVIMRESMKHAAGQFYRLRITMPQFVTLAFLSRQGDAKMTDMAHHMNVTTAAMTGVIDRLARDGYVSRGHDPKDRRVVKVKVTAKGSRLVERLSRERRKALMNMFGKISQEEREKYLEILTHIKEHLTAPEKT